MLGSVFVNYERQMICIHVKTRTARATTTRPTLNHPSTIADATATTSNAANESAGAGTTMTSMPLLMWYATDACGSSVAVVSGSDVVPVPAVRMLSLASAHYWTVRNG